MKSTKALGYVRVSTSEQGNSGASLQAQIQAIREEAEKRGWELLDIREEVATGRSLSKRPVLQQALLDLDSGFAQGLLVAKLDRLARSVVDVAHVLGRARSKGWTLTVLDNLGLDTASANGRLIAHVFAAVGEWEAEMIGIRTKDALAQKRLQGVRLGRPPEASPELHDRVASLRHQGATYRSIAALFNVEQVPTVRGGKSWTPKVIRMIAMRTDAPTYQRGPRKQQPAA